MPKNSGKKPAPEKRPNLDLHPETRKSIWAVLFVGAAVLLLLSSFAVAGPAGGFIFGILEKLFGWGFYLLPAILVFMAVVLFSESRAFLPTALIGGAIFVAAGLGLIDVLFPGEGGILGRAVGALEIPFGFAASLVLIGVFLVVSVLIILNTPIKLRRTKPEPPMAVEKDLPVKLPVEIPAPVVASAPAASSGEDFKSVKGDNSKAEAVKPAKIKDKNGRSYVFPPLSLLKSSAEKPTVGDLRANANIIKRTFDNFGVPVEMGEINVGPSVTRYTLKPADGVKLSRITALNQDLALALAAHPIRIEAPIPGRSLVGIEAPNKSAALVRLGNLLAYPDFKAAGLLSFALGRDVSGEPIFTNLEKMPHLLIAGSTGSGKSIALHSLLISLLYKNSPQTLKLALIDPKRVELSVYNKIPHLAAPVVTEGKKTLGVFRWAIGEMERRYVLLSGSGCRDVKSYNASRPDAVLPYLVIIIDELADLMAAYGREIEGSIIRLAQMARATGIHLVVSTQRPSVEVITGLIKANITSRVALQVASQVDSRTILDAAGAEKLLGSGDLLFVSPEFSKPKRIQGAYVTEEEAKNVCDFIVSQNRDFEETGAEFEEVAPAGGGVFEEYAEDDGDELYDEALRVVVEAGKASASLLQRRLKVGYARAARLLDILESRGVIGPGDGAKPREVFVKREEGD